MKVRHECNGGLPDYPRCIEPFRVHLLFEVERCRVDGANCAAPGDIIQDRKPIRREPAIRRNHARARRCGTAIGKQGAQIVVAHRGIPCYRDG